MTTLHAPVPFDADSLTSYLHLAVVTFDQYPNAGEIEVGPFASNIDRDEWIAKFRADTSPDWYEVTYRVRTFPNLASKRDYIARNVAEIEAWSFAE